MPILENSGRFFFFLTFFPPPLLPIDNQNDLYGLLFLILFHLCVYELNCLCETKSDWI